jgi:hypothetical protein
MIWADDDMGQERKDVHAAEEQPVIDILPHQKAHSWRDIFIDLGKAAVGFACFE